MKKKKLNLEELKVQSFVTLNKDQLNETIKGGVADRDDELVPLPKNPIDTILCPRTPDTWCYHCPPEF
ncbi:MAG: pinensin family lanthipeptide [Bacteroidota bacterium]